MSTRTSLDVCTVLDLTDVQSGQGLQQNSIRPQELTPPPSLETGRPNSLGDERKGVKRRVILNLIINSIIPRAPCRRQATL